MANDNMKSLATHYAVLVKQDGMWKKDKQRFRGIYSAEAAALDTGLTAGEQFLVTEYSWADFILKELNRDSNKGSVTPMLTAVKG